MNNSLLTSLTATVLRTKAVSFRHIVSPYDIDGTKTYIAVLNVKDIPSDIEEWRKINVRDANLNSGVAKKIAETLEDEPESFFFKNRGMTILASKVDFDNKTNILSIEMSDTTMHGLLDGGHTFKVIRKFVEDQSDAPDEIPAFVKVEILEGINDKEQVVDIVYSRNTSTQVKQQGLDDLMGLYEGIKSVLKDKEYGERIAYKEFELLEDGSRKDIDIKDILSYLMCFDIENFGDKNHPIQAYTSKSAVVEYFHKHRDRLAKYVKLLPSILELHDTIYFTLQSAYNVETGGKFGRLTGVKPLKRTKIDLPFIGKKSSLSIPSGFIYPILAAFRNLIKIESDKCVWKTNPIKFYEANKTELATRVVEQALVFRNPNKLGKDAATWRGCYDEIQIEAYKRNI